MSFTLAPSQADDLGLAAGADAEDARQVKQEGADPEEINEPILESRAESSTTAVLESQADRELTDEEQQTAEQTQQDLIEQWKGDLGDVNPSELDPISMDAVDSALDNGLINEGQADQFREELRDDGDDRDDSSDGNDVSTDSLPNGGPVDPIHVAAAVVAIALYWVIA